PESFGELLADYVRLAPLAPVREASAAWSARIIHIDRFGNLVTNLTERELAGEEFAPGAKLEIGGREISSFRRFYAEAEGGAGGELFAIWGSAGFLEIAADRASAAELLRAERGQRVRVTRLAP
ncbi:MAG TPA: SAM hydroxide adenosyltransferase, partial [Pyrinomonadaceae bacterium]|nr:SAM hydroxide adenosyltransferase [Pyrinomonadaceae bacterium]